jgi:argininosuccinate lyase
MLGTRTAFAALLAVACAATAATRNQAPKRDEFFWLGEINKASAVINTDEGLLDRAGAADRGRPRQGMLQGGGEARRQAADAASSPSSRC